MEGNGRARHLTLSEVSSSLGAFVSLASPSLASPPTLKKHHARRLARNTHTRTRTKTGSSTHNGFPHCSLSRQYCLFISLLRPFICQSNLRGRGLLGAISRTLFSAKNVEHYSTYITKQNFLGDGVEPGGSETKLPTFQK